MKNMESTCSLLAVLFLVGLHLSSTSGDSSATWEDFEKSSAVWVQKHFSSSSGHQRPKLFSQLTSAATAGNDSSNSTSGWLVQCNNLSDDLEKSWNLTVVAAEANWPIVESVAETLYTMLLDCTQGHIWGDAECLIKNLNVLRTILVPAVKMNLVYVQRAWQLIPEFVKASKECLTFGS